MEILLFMWLFVVGLTWSHVHAKTFAQLACIYCAGYKDTRNCNAINTYTRAVRCVDEDEVCFIECISEYIVKRGCSRDRSNRSTRR